MRRLLEGQRRARRWSRGLTAQYCFVRDEQYLIDEDGKVAIIDEGTGRVMADRSWASRACTRRSR